VSRFVWFLCLLAFALGLGTGCSEQRSTATETRATLPKGRLPPMGKRMEMEKAKHEKAASTANK
jgi:hypothetical protein